MSRKPSMHRQKVVKKGDLWWSVCTCGRKQGWHSKLDALKDRNSHEVDAVFQRVMAWRPV